MREQENLINRLLIIAGVVLVVILLLYFMNFHYGFADDQAVWGAFGDLLGGTLGPILSFSAVMVALKTLELQREDMRDQDEKNRLAQIQQDNDRKEQKKQQELSVFESNFNNLLRIHNDVVYNLEIPIEITRSNHDTYWTDTIYKKGAVCFKEIYTKWTISYSGPSGEGVERRDSIQKRYEDIYSIYDYIIGQYFRRLYNIIEFVDQYKGDFLGTTDTEEFENKKKYIKLLRSQLSVFELKLLFYNSLTTYGTDYLHFIKKYELLKGVITSENSDFSFTSDILWATEHKFITESSWKELGLSRPIENEANPTDEA